MAPNIKKLNLLASSLAELDINVQPKFLPLTHPQEAQQTVQEQPVIRTPASESASYWDWPADVPEEPKDLFSAAALEANLIKDSQREASADIIVNADAAEHDDYWCEREQEVDATKPQHDSYWSWPADPKEARIQAIVEEEHSRQLLSTDKIVKNLIASQWSERVHSQKPESDSYWAWESSPVEADLDEAYSKAYWEWKSDAQSEVNKEEMVQSILRSEVCRQAVSLAKLEENLKKLSLPEKDATLASSDDYWSWQEPTDSYWDWSAKPVDHTQGYWDW